MSNEYKNWLRYIWDNERTSSFDYDMYSAAVSKMFGDKKYPWTHGQVLEFFNNGNTPYVEDNTPYVEDNTPNYRSDPYEELLEGREGCHAVITMAGGEKSWGTIQSVKDGILTLNQGPPPRLSPLELEPAPLLSHFRIRFIQTIHRIEPVTKEIP